MSGDRPNKKGKKLGKIHEANDVIMNVIKADASARATSLALKKLEPNTVEYARAKSTLEVWCEIIAKYTNEPYEVVYARYAAVTL